MMTTVTTTTVNGYFTNQTITTTPVTVNVTPVTSMFDEVNEPAEEDPAEETETAPADEAAETSADSGASAGSGE